MKIIEIIGDYQVAPIGYLATNIETDELLYFVEIDVEQNKMVTIDLAEDNTKKEYKASDYFSKMDVFTFDSFSLLSLVKESQNSRSLKRKFWGTECGPESTTGLSYCCHYVFWIENGCSWQ